MANHSIYLQWQAISGQSKAELHLTAKVDSVNSNYMFIKAELHNRSTDTVCYVGWSCSWPKLFFIDENALDNATIFWCDKNIPEVFKLAPGEWIERVLTFSKIRYGNDRNFKLHYYFIPFRNLKSMYSNWRFGAEIKKEAIILSSNSLTL